MRNRHYAGLLLSLASLVVLLCINFDLHLKQDAPISSGPATTGKEFDGQKFRTFDKKLVADFAVGAIFSDDSIEKYAGKMCEKWAVMTTITSPASEALRRFLYKMDWCVVVVGDINGPQVINFYLNIPFHVSGSPEKENFLFLKPSNEMINCFNDW